MLVRHIQTTTASRMARCVFVVPGLPTVCVCCAAGCSTTPTTPRGTNYRTGADEREVRERHDVCSIAWTSTVVHRITPVCTTTTKQGFSDASYYLAVSYLRSWLVVLSRSR